MQAGSLFDNILSGNDLGEIKHLLNISFDKESESINRNKNNDQDEENDKDHKNNESDNDQ